MARATRPLSTRRAASSVTGAAVAFSCLALLANGPGYNAPPSSRAPRRSDLHTRANLPRQTLELKDPEPEPEKEHVVLPERRVPYKLSYYINSDSFQEEGHHPSDVNYEYMVEKVQDALQPMEDWIVSATLRMHVDHHEHSHFPKNGAHTEVVQPARTAAADEDVGEEVLVLDHKRGLAPYRLDVTVHMKQDMVAISGDKHARASFTEAVDHVHDLLRMKLQKEKEKRIHLKRRSMATEMQAVSDDSLAWSEEEELEAARAATDSQIAEDRATMERMEWTAEH